MNVVLVTGNLTKDPEMTQKSGETEVCKFSLAVRREYKRDGDPDADFIRVTAFGKTASLVDQYLRKGSKVGVSARVQTGSYISKDGGTVYTTDFIANSVEFLGGKRDAETATPAAVQRSYETPDNDVPF